MNSSVTYDTLTIPSSIDGKLVKRIEHVFNSKNNFVNLIIPDTVYEIGEYAVFHCNGLKTVNILGNVYRIESFAFDSCKSLESINLPDSINDIAQYAFFDCESLKSITLPSELRKLDDNIFTYCYSLADITLNNNLESIGDSFQYCTSLKTITIPSSVRSISQSAFLGCNEMTSVTVTDGNYKYSSNDGMLYNRIQTSLIFCPPSKSGEVTVPPSVITVGESAFRSCMELTKINLPDNLMVIEDGAFNGCIGLTEIKIPSSVIYLGNNALTDCINLTTVNIPSNISIINSMLFANCLKLTEVTLPSNTTQIGMGAFYGCTSLNQISIPSKVTKLGDYAFYGCANLNKVTFIGNKPSIGNMAFPASGTVLYYPISRASSWSSLTDYSKQTYCYVTINLQNGSAASKVMTNVTNGLINAPASPAARTGYTFKGWFKEAACTNAWNFKTDVITKDISVYAKWDANTYTIKFDSQGGSSVASKTAKYDSLITAPMPPTRNGYAFGGWYKEKECKNAWNFSASKITGSITLYAKWVCIYKITASSNNAAYGFVSGADSYASGSAVTLKAVPKSGYRFVRWLEGTSEVSTNAEYKFTVSKSRTLKAEFALIGTPTLKTSSASYSSVKLSWGTVSGAKSYSIYRSTSSSGSYSKIASTTSTSYVNTGLSTGKTYYYKVRAICTAGTVTTYGAYSAAKSAKPVPAKSGNAKAVSKAYNSINLTWYSVTGATKYEIYRATSSTGTYTKLTETASLSYTNANLVTGTVYYYKIKAYRLVGTTKVYGYFCGVISAKAIPSTPTNIQADKSSSTGVKLSWTAVSGATKYEIYGSSGGSYTKLGETSSLSFTQSKLAAGKTYYYKVRAYRVVGTKKVYGNFASAVSIKL